MPSAAEMLVLGAPCQGVVLALCALRKTRDTAQLAQRVHAVAPTGEDLVRIGLVAHIPHQAVGRACWRHMVQGLVSSTVPVGFEVPAVV